MNAKARRAHVARKHQTPDRKDRTSVWSSQSLALFYFLRTISDISWRWRMDSRRARLPKSARCRKPFVCRSASHRLITKITTYAVTSISPCIRSPLGFFSRLEDRLVGSDIAATHAQPVNKRPAQVCRTMMLVRLAQTANLAAN